MKFKNTIILLISVFLFPNIYAESDIESGYKIKVNAPFKEGSVAYLANYWEGNTYAIDSIIVPQGGNIVFTNAEKELTAGQYLLYIKPDIQMEFLLDKGQNEIHIEIDENDFSKSKIIGSKDTQVFWQYIKELESLHNNVEKYVALINNAEIGSQESNQAVKLYEETLDKVGKLSERYIKANKDTWVSSFIKATSPIREPYPVPQSKEQSIENANYVKKHYFDNVDFSDIRLWNTSFFVPQMKNYLEQLIIQNPDTIAKETSWIVNKSMKDEATFQKTLSYFVQQSSTSLAMGMENVWAKLAEDYIFDKNLSWIDSIQYNSLKADYALLEHNRMGQIGQNLNLRTINGDSIKTSDIEAEFLIIYFYSPTCSYCRLEMPKLRSDLYPKYKDKGLKVVAVNLDRDMESWKAFIEQNNMEDWYNAFDPDFKSEYWLKYNTSGTPSLYLLDKNKTIIAKKLDIENLDKYLERITN